MSYTDSLSILNDLAESAEAESKLRTFGHLQAVAREWSRIQQMTKQLVLEQ